jgi:hypothetical protein
LGQNFRIKGGATKRASLGKTGDLSLEAAREHANQLTAAARRGVDLLAEEAARDAPEAERRWQEAQRLTIGQLIAEYVRKRAYGRLKSAAAFERKLQRALAPIAAMKAADVKRRDLRQLLDATSDSGRCREAEKRRQAIGAMFHWTAMARLRNILKTRDLAGLIARGGNRRHKDGGGLYLRISPARIPEKPLGDEPSKP